MDFEPALLRALVAVKEHGGFTRAAERLHLTQSAVSHQIRRLEEQVGRPLLYRTTRSLTLTEDGEDFLRYAQQILHTLDALNRRFHAAPVSGVVRFGVPDNFIGEQLPGLLCQFARAFPSVRMDVSVGMHLDLRAMIKSGELDLAVALSGPKTVEGTVLRQTQFVWAAAEGFEKPQHAPLPLAFYPPPCIGRQVAVTALERCTADWSVVFTSPSHQGLRAAVLAGLAIAPLTRGDLEPGMKVVDGQYGLPRLPKAHFTLLCGAGGKTPAALEFGRLILNLPAPRRAAARPRKRA
jgi:DNA-binding transcriptional LysR family regulator